MPQRAPTAAADLGGNEDLLSPCPLGGCLSHTQMLKRSRKKAFWLLSKAWVTPRVFMSKLRKLVSYKVVRMKWGHVHNALNKVSRLITSFLFPKSTICRFSAGFPFFLWNCSLLISTKSFKIPSSDILSLTSVLSIILNRRCAMYNSQSKSEGREGGKLAQFSTYDLRSERTKSTSLQPPGTSKLLWR